MAIDAHIKFEGIKGESTKVGREGQVEVLAWHWGMSQTGTFQSGSGGGAGKANINDLTLTKWLDVASPNLMLFCASGKIVKEAILTMRKVSGDGKGGGLEYIKIVLKDVIVSSVSTGGSESEERLTENVSLNFAQCEFHFTTQKADGTKGESPNFKWDVSKNKQL